MDERFSDLGDEWSRPWKVSRVLGALGMEVPDRLRRERLLLMMARLQEQGLEAVLPNYAPVDSIPPSIELKLRLRRKPRTLFSKYRVLQQLSSGGMSEGFKVRADDTTAYFLKRVRVSGKLADALSRELGVYSKLERNQVVNLLAFHGFERDDEHLALVTEFADGGTLEEYVTLRGMLDLVEAKQVALNVLAGVRELHTLNIVYRDLKPANILRVGERWKLGDFGISKDLERVVTQGKTFKQHGSEGFAPPEQWDWSEAHPSADVHAFGSLLAYLVTGQKGWPTEVLAIQAPAAVEKLGHKAWASLVRRCTARAAEDRPSLNEVEGELARLT